jgi:protein-S-isoprenylcysteine O-methyltransferase Ste14
MSALSESRLSISSIQLIRKAVLLILVIGGGFVAVFADSLWPDGGFTHEAIELAGFFLIVFCIVGRTWCSLYIGGLKNRSLIDAGPYSITRNPLYVFSVIGAVGVGAQLGSIVIALLTGVIVWAVFYILIFSEERHLVSCFGVKYRNYMVKVPRFFPNFALWRDMESLTIKPSNVRGTFVDACVFLLSIPICEGFDRLHDLGIVPVLFQLP